MKKIKAIKVDTVSKEIYEIEIAPELQSYYKEMNCDLIEVGSRVYPTMYNTDEIIQQSILADVLYVDEEGSWKPNTGFIFCTGYGQYIRTFLGTSLVMGTDEEGNTVSHKQDIEKFKKFITFFE
jgi:hypothetical protein